MPHKIFYGSLEITMAASNLEYSTTTAADMYRQFPGFPPYVHQIMANICNGMTPEEAAQAVDPETLRREIELEISHAVENRVETPLLTCCDIQETDDESTDLESGVPVQQLSDQLQDTL